MLSDVTISFADHTLTFPGLYLLIGCLVIVGLAGFIVAMNSTRRIERKTSEATDILVVQLERIGDALDRIVSHNATRVVNEPPRRPERSPLEWAVPGRAFPPRVVQEGSALDRAAQKPAPASMPAPEPLQAQDQAQKPPDQPAQEKPAEEQPIESTLSEPARSILFSMLGR